MSLLKDKRQEAGLSVSEVARRVGMTVTRLWKIENGQLRLKVDDVPAIARALGCKPADLIPDIPTEEAPTHA